LHSVERKLDAAFAARIAAESSRAALSAKYADRLIQYGVLHDTVLSTLTAIARGGLDYRAPRVQERCAREAEYLRRLIGGLSDPIANDGLGGALARLVTEAEEIGLRVRYFADTLPELPPDAVMGINWAAREALNNIKTHAGTDQAWITAVGDGGGITVTVTDRGAGFNQQEPSMGFGIRQSIVQRMLDAGGAATITSVPGHGTSVEMTWPC
jgi:signal transduction histidine kinase